MKIPTELIISILALVASVVAVWITVKYNKLSLEQARNHIYAQLTYQDRKEALMELHKIVNKSAKQNFSQLTKSINEFVHSKYALYLSGRVISDIFKEMHNAKERIKVFDPRIEASEEETEHLRKEWEKSLSKRDYYDKMEDAITGELYALKANITGIISREIHQPVIKSKE